MLMEQMEYNLLFRWFTGLSANDPHGIPLYSRRTATDCWRALSLRSSFR